MVRSEKCKSLKCFHYGTNCDNTPTKVVQLKTVMFNHYLRQRRRNREPHQRSLHLLINDYVQTIRILTSVLPNWNEYTEYEKVE